MQAQPPSKRSRREEPAPDSRPAQPTEKPEVVTLLGGVPCPDGQINLWRSGTLCDATITVEGRKFSAHRAILAGASDVLRALFTSEMADHAAPQLQEMSSIIFGSVVEFIYTGQCGVSEAELTAMLEVAVRLQMASLQESTTDAIISRIVPENAAAFWASGEASSMPRISAAAKGVALRSFASFAAAPAFTSLAPELLQDLVGDEALEASEENVFAAVSAWCLAVRPPPDPATVESLFSRVRFPLMSHAFLTGQVPPRRRGRRRPVPHPRAMP